MSEDSREKTESTQVNSGFETVDPDAGSKLINEKVAQAAISSEGRDANVAEKLIQRFKDLIGRGTSKIEGGQMLTGSGDVDKLLADTLRRKLVQASQ